MSAPAESPLSRAAELARESMHILLDYLKVASAVHVPDQYQPGASAVSHLVDAMDEIQKLRDGDGRRGTHVGGISAEH